MAMKSLRIMEYGINDHFYQIWLGSPHPSLMKGLLAVVFMKGLLALLLALLLNWFSSIRIIRRNGDIVFHGSKIARDDLTL